MAGFLNRDSTSLFTKISKNLKKISLLGMEFDNKAIKQSMATGNTESEFGDSSFLTSEMRAALSLQDMGEKKFIAYFDREYKARREYLRRFSMNSEIEFITEVISDEAIVYDDMNYFCYPNIKTLKEHLNGDKLDEMTEYINNEFKRIYSIFNFKSSHDAWHYFKKFLIDGFLAFEIIYDEEGEKIIRFKELDALSLKPDVVESGGKLQKIWTQYEDNIGKGVELLDEQVLYISYAKSNFVSRLSYVERLVRSFNLLRILENSRIIWNIMNSSYRLKMVVPIGTKSPQKAKQSLQEMLSIYKEDISLNWDSGELLVNGQPTLQFYKNYLVPSKAGEQPEIDTIGGDGPDLSDMDALDYFVQKLREDSRVPNSRFDRENPGSITFDASGQDYDEIRFGKFIDRLRSIFREILLKPLWIQLTLKYPELTNDFLIKSNLGIKYNKDNIFEKDKEMTIKEKEANFIRTMQDITIQEPDESGMMNDVSFFDPEFLIQKYMGNISDTDLKLNKKMKEAKEKRDLEKIKKMKDAEGDDFGGF